MKWLEKIRFERGIELGFELGFDFAVTSDLNFVVRKKRIVLHF